MSRKSYVVVPNVLIMVPGSSAAKRLLVALLGYSMPRRKKGVSVRSTSRSYKELRELSGIQSDTTLHNAIRQLVEMKILKCINHYAYSYARERMERTRNVYELDAAYLRHLSDQGGYALIPRALLSCKLTNAQFAVALLLYKLAGSRGVARPSIRQIAAMLGIAKSTVCLALRCFREMQLFIRILRKYVGRHGGTGYRKNRYCVTDSPFAISRKKYCKKPSVRLICSERSGQFFFFKGGGPKNGEQELLTS